MNKARISRRVAQSVSELSDGLVQAAVGIDKGVPSPKPFLYLFPRQHLSGMFQEQTKQLQWFVLQRYGLTLFPQNTVCRVEFEIIEPHH
jgi:hypothetical protein